MNEARSRVLLPLFTSIKMHIKLQFKNAVQCAVCLLPRKIFAP